MQWPFRLLNECHHRVEKPDISNKKRRGVLSLDLPSCFTRQIQRFWGGISRFGFQKRNRRPRIALGWSWSGARLLAYAKESRTCMFAQWLIADNGTSNSPQINAGVPGAVVVWPVRAHATNPSCHESIHGCWARAEGHVCMYVGVWAEEGRGWGCWLSSAHQRQKRTAHE